jgi:ABC-type tungstate transport system substrate-binding protein
MGYNVSNVVTLSLIFYSKQENVIVLLKEIFNRLNFGYRGFMRRSYCIFLQLGEFGATLMFAGNIPGKTQTIPTAILCQ